jgi:acyl carrier protein
MRAKPAKKSVHPSSLYERLQQLLQDVLGLSSETASTFTPQTELFGALPELDSMAVAALLTEIEDRFVIVIDDDDIDGEIFETFGSLLAFVEAKVAAQS